MLTTLRKKKIKIPVPARATVIKYNNKVVPIPRVINLTEKKFPVSETLKVVDGKTLYKNDRWWSAVVALESFGRKQVCIYLWNKKGDEWKRRQKFVVTGQSNWEKLKAAVESLLPYLTGDPQFVMKEP